MAQKFRNPLAQVLGIVLQNMRDEMGGVSSSQVASSLGLAASHYRMVEAGSAILQPARAIKIAQTFDTVEFVPLCQILVAIQVIDSARQSVRDMQGIVRLLTEANPSLAIAIKEFEQLWETVESGQSSDVAKRIVAIGMDRDMATFLTTEPASFTTEQIHNFMTPTYEHPFSGQLYDKIGNILQGLAPFYLDTVLQLIENLKNVTPRVTPEELGKWEAQHKNRISYIIGIVRRPEILLDTDSFDYTFLWEENFRKLLIIHRDPAQGASGPVEQKIIEGLRVKLESERVRYERQLSQFDEAVGGKLAVRHGEDLKGSIDEILLHQSLAMNNLWVYIMSSGYVVVFIDNAEPGGAAGDLYGTSLDYDETCRKLVLIRKLCDDVGLTIGKP